MQAFGVIIGEPIPVPLVLMALCAGFPSPADDYLDGPVDLSRHLITNPPATFLFRVEGDSMIEAGIRPGCLLVVDRSRTPRHGSVVVADVNGERSVKRFLIEAGHPRLAFANRRFPAFDPGPAAVIEVWGVATYAVGSLG